MKDWDNKVPRLGFIRAVESPRQLEHDEITRVDLMKSALLFGKHGKQPVCVKL